MNREIPQELLYFLKNGIKDVDDGYEYANELRRILHSDKCQQALTTKELELLRDYADKVASLGEINYYIEERIKETEADFFGDRGILGFLGIQQPTHAKPIWPF